ncbi:MAG: hypothetical protein V3R41_06015 [Gammaproteobacteria bacterium]
MANKFHKDLIEADNHAVIGVAPYADITARDMDSLFNTNVANVNKIVRVTDADGAGTIGYFILVSIAPAWESLGASLTDSFLELIDTPSTYVGQGDKLLRVNAAENAVEFADRHILDGETSGVSLDLTSILGAFRPNRLTTTQRDALTALAGMTIFNTTTSQLETFNGTSWIGDTASDSFLELIDTPSSYTGQAGKVVQVNSTPDGLEFGQNLTTAGDPTFAGLTVNGNALITNTVVSDVALLVKGVVSQTAHLVRIVDSSDAVRWSIFPDGDVFINGQIRIDTAEDTFNGIRIKGSSPTQSADLIRVLNSASALLFTIGEDGSALFQNDANTLTSFQILDADGGTPIFNVDTNNERVGIGTASPFRTLHVSGDALFRPIANANSIFRVEDGAGVSVFNVDTLSAQPIVSIQIGLRVTGFFADSSGDVGAAGQILSSTVTGTNWINNATGDVNSTGTPIDNQIAIWTNANTIEGDPDFTWDGATLVLDTDTFVVNATTNRVGIGIAIPETALHIQGGVESEQLMIRSTTLLENAGFTLGNSTGAWEIQFRTNPNNGWFEIASNIGAVVHRWHGVDYMLASTGKLYWSSNSTFSGAGVTDADVVLFRDAANVLRTNDSFVIDLDLEVKGAFKDSSGDVGTLGQFLSSTVTGTDWITGGTGNVNSFGTPLNNQLAIWTDATTIEGDPKVTFDGSSFNVTGEGLFTGDFFIDTPGSNSGAPRLLKFSSLSAGEFARLEFGGEGTSLQTGNAQALDIVAFHTLRLHGDSNSAVAPSFSTESDIGVHVINSSMASPALVVSGASGQTANLFQVRNSAATVLADFDKDGNLTVGTGVGVGLTDITIFQDGGVTSGLTFSGLGTSGGNSTTEGVTLYNGFNFTGNNQFWISNTVDLGDVLKNSIRFFTSGDCPLIAATNNAGSGNKSFCLALNFAGANCGVGFPIGAAQADIISKLHVQAGASTVIGLIAQGASGQTADIFQARNFGGTPVFSLDNEGRVHHLSLGRLATAISTNTGIEPVIGVTDTTVGRTITIESAGILDDQVYIIKDESGAASNPNPITIVTEGSETIDGLTSVQIKIPFGVVRLYAAGGNLFSW